MRHTQTHIILPALLLAACGTVVGNPKQPGSTSSGATTSATDYQLPTLGFQLPAEATVADAALALADTSTGLGANDRGLLVSWGQRVNKLSTEIDNVTTRINALITKERAKGNESEPLVFTNKGEEAQLSGRIATLPAGGTYAYEAVLCYGGRVFADFKWSEDNTQIDLVRDFSVQADGVVNTYGVRSHLNWQNTSSLALTLATQGTWTDAILAANPYLTEYSQVQRLASKELDIKTVQEHSLTQPSTYGADSYLVGRLEPKTSAASAYNSEFAAYFAGAAACKEGFSETASDLWHPASLTEPHFCIGRPIDGVEFTSLTQYYSTLSDLQPVGIATQSQLETVDFAAGSSCN